MANGGVPTVVVDSLLLSRVYYAAGGAGGVPLVATLVVIFTAIVECICKWLRPV